MRNFLRERAWLRYTLFAFLGLYLLYVGLMSWLFSFGGAEKLLKDVKSARVRTASGYSFWPGRISAKDLEFVYQDRNVTIQILAENVDVELGLFDLVSRRIHLERVKAAGTRFRMRHRVRSNVEGHRERLSGFPVIEGFERTPLVTGRAQKAKNPITVQVDEIDAYLDEIWILEYRTKGEFRAQGGFTIDEQIRVAQSTVDLSFAETTISDKKVLNTDDCTIAAKLGPFPRFRPSGEQILTSVTSKVSCRTRSPDLSFIQIYPRKIPLEVMGSATVDMDFRMKKGQLEAGEIRIPETTTPWTYRGLRFPMTWRATMKIPKPGLLETDATASISKGSLGFNVDRVALNVAVRHDVISHPQIRAGKLEIRELRIEDGDFLERVTQSRKAPWIRVHSTHLSADYDETKGTFDLKGTPAFTWDTGKLAIGMESRIDLHCKIEGKSTNCPTLQLSTENLSVNKDGEVESMSARLDAHEFSATWPTDISTRVRVRTGPPRKLLAHALGLGFLKQAGLSIIGLGEVDGVIALKKSDSTIAGNVVELNSGKVTIDGRFVSDHHWLSSWLIRTPVGRYGIRQSPSGVKFSPLVPVDWFSSCEARLGTDC